MRDRSQPQVLRISLGTILFDIKLEFTRKVIFGGGIYLVDPPQYVGYSSAVSSDTVRIILVIAALNDRYVKLFDIGHLYLNI